MVRAAAFRRRPCSRHCLLIFSRTTWLQIRFFLLQNRQGKTRLSKWYVDITEPEKRKIESEVHRSVAMGGAAQLAAPDFSAVLVTTG